MTVALWALCRPMDTGQNTACLGAGRETPAKAMDLNWEARSKTKHWPLTVQGLHVYCKQNRKDTSKQREISYGGAWEWSQKAVIWGTQHSLSLSFPFLSPASTQGHDGPRAKLGGSIHSWARRQELKTQDGGFSRDTETKLV